MLSLDVSSGGVSGKIRPRPGEFDIRWGVFLMPTVLADLDSIVCRGNGGIGVGAVALGARVVFHTPILPSGVLCFKCFDGKV